MKKGIISVICVLLGVLGLAGEVALLLYTRRSYVSARRQEYANELKDSVVKISASLRMGEVEHYNEALASFDDSLEKISPYLEAEDKARLIDYRSELESEETQALMKLNEVLLNVKASMKEPQAIESLENEQELTKLNEALLKLKSCEVYCSVKDYREIETTLTEESEKLSQKLDAKEQENAARLGSEELIEWLSMLK